MESISPELLLLLLFTDFFIRQTTTMLATVRQTKEKGATKARSIILGCLLRRCSLSWFGALHGVKPYESPHNSVLLSSEIKFAVIDGTLPAKLLNAKFRVDG